MERSWLETIHLVGLDLQVAYVLLLLLLERLVALGGRRVRRRAAGALRDREAATGEAATGPWPPAAWRPSH